MLLQRAEASHPAPSLLLAGAQQVQTLPGSSENHREALVLRHRPRQPPQRLGLAAFTDALHLGDGDWRRESEKEIVVE